VKRPCLDQKHHKQSNCSQKGKLGSSNTGAHCVLVWGTLLLCFLY
jgi:hypothetical protein